MTFMLKLHYGLVKYLQKDINTQREGLFSKCMFPRYQKLLKKEHQFF